jgi:dTDP-4-amino-4,6-dideoxygalactose transaminase
MKSSQIPVFKPLLPKAPYLAPYLERIDQSRIYSNRGPLLTELEEKYAHYCNVDSSQVVAMSNATVGIQAAISISSPQNWIVPNYTFSATGLAVMNANRRLLLSDVSLDDWQLLVPKDYHSDANDFGILPVLPFGAAPDLSKWEQYKNVIIDAAASLGTGPFDFASLPKTWIIVFSLHATKVLGAGEGALLICGSARLAEQIRQWSNFGFSSTRESLIQGTNAKMAEVSAAYGLAAFSQFNIERSDWIRVQKYIREGSVNSKLFNFTLDYPGFNPYWVHICESLEQKDALRDALSRSGIDSRSWWSKGLSEMKGINGSKIMNLGNSLQLSETVIGLPKYRDISRESIERVLGVIKDNLHSAITF